MSLRLHWLGLCALAVLCGCAGTPSSTPPFKGAANNATEAVRTKLVGTWQFEQSGVKIDVTYTPTTVTMLGVPPTPYTLVGNEITVDVLGPKTSIIEFRGNDEMTQTNKTDGERYVFKRKRN